MHLRARIVLVAVIASSGAGALSPASAASVVCESHRQHRPLLGEYTSALARDVLLTVQQKDLDVELVVRRGNLSTVYDAPGGRNGLEWVVLKADLHDHKKVCVYAVYGQKASNAYDIVESELSALDARSREALSDLSEAGALWATGSETGRTNAIARYQSVANRVSTPSQLRSYARLYAAAGQVQRYQYDEALDTLAKLNPSAEMSYQVPWLKGIVFNRRNEFTSSVDSLTKALRLAQESQAALHRSLRRDIVEITNLLGEANLSAGKFEQGVALVNQALSESGDDHQLLGMVHNNAGYVDILRADRGSLAERSRYLSLSLEDHFKARDHALRAGDLQELAIIENNIASLFERMGDLRKAREHYEEALRLLGASDDPLRFEVLYRNLGHVYQYLGDYEKSERFTNAAIRISEAAAPSDAIRLHCRLGTLHRLRNHLTDAVSEHTMCRSRAASARLMKQQVEALYELAVDWSEQSNLEAATGAIDQASALLSQIADRDLSSKVQAQQALLMQAKGERERARQLADAAIDAAQGARYPTVAVDALATAMNISVAQRDADAAVKYGMRAVEAIETLHSHLDVERLGPAWSARTQDVYDQLAQIAIDKYARSKNRADLEHALGILERGRAVSLRQQFSAPLNVHQQLAASPLLATLSAIANQSARGSLAATGDPLPLAYYHAHDLLTRSRLAGVTDVPVPAPLAVTQVQRSLAPDTTALYYFFSARRAFVFIVQRDDLQLIDLGDRAAIDAAVAKLRAAMLAGPGMSIEPLQALSRSLLPPRTLRGSHLIVVPDGSLYTVPFAALRASGTSGAYVPLVEQFAIKVVPSMSAYLMPKAKQASAHEIDLAVFANPTFDAGATATPVRGSLPLPSTEREAERLRALFAPERTKVFTRAAASRANLLSAPARDARVLHIASHGHFDSSSPDNVGFALSTRRSRAGFDSGFVTLTELFTQPFDNDLVVISGCDTAMGLQREGVGMMSVARAFIAQGASHVISTLWAVSDQASAEFMPLFYSRLSSTGSISEALQYAQRQLRDRKPYADPFFWAPYVMTTVQPDDTLRFGSGSVAQRE